MSNKLERIVAIEKIINRGSAPSPAYLARELEVSERTILGDIQYMKHRMHLSIEYDPARKGYVNTKPSKGLPAFDLSDSELVALAISKGMLVRHSSNALQHPMESALEKIVERNNGSSSTIREKIDKSVNFKLASNAPFQRKLLEDVLESIETRQVLEIVYYATYRNETECRRIEPLIVQETTGSWYVWAWCRLRKDYRYFALQRIKEWKVLKETFSHRPDADKKLILAERTFQLEERHPPITVRIQFDELAARYVKEKKWHEDQKISEHSDGSIDLEFATMSLEETKRWVLFYGSHASVLEPVELRKMVHGELTQALANYEDVRKEV